MTQLQIKRAPTAQQKLDAARDTAVLQLNRDYQAEYNRFVAKWPPAEREAWPGQIDEARKYRTWLNGAQLLAQAPATPLIDNILTGRDGSATKASRTAMADTIIARDANMAAWHQRTGRRQKLEAQIRAATTPEAAAAVKWQTTGA